MNVQGYDQEGMAARLRELRQKRGLQQKDLAKEIGVSYAAISGYECGLRQPHLSSIIMLADYFGVTVEYLVGREDLLDGLKIERAREDGYGQVLCGS